MRFIEFLTEGLAKKTYRNRRVLPIDAAWARGEFRKVDKSGQGRWATESDDPTVKTISWRKEVALIDHVQANLDSYVWTNEADDDHTEFMVVWTKQDMQDVDLVQYGPEGQGQVHFGDFNP